MSRTNLSPEQTIILEKGLGEFYKLPDVIVENIMEFLKTSEVKNLRLVSRPIQQIADNEDKDIRNQNRLRHVDISALKYKMLDKNRIENIILNSPSPFPPNSYFEEHVMSRDNKLYFYSNFVILGPSINLFIEETKSFYNHRLGRESVFSDSVYTTAKYFFKNYNKNDYNYLNGDEIAYPLSDPYNEHIDPIHKEETLKNIKKYVYILKNSINEDFTFTIPLKNRYGDEYFYNKINIKKIS